MSSQHLPDEPIHFYSEQAPTDFTLHHSTTLVIWICQAIHTEGGLPACVNFIFCNDSFLHQINVTYLKHDTLTDVITFPYAENPLEGDIYISVERVSENAEKYRVTFDQELHRVMIHGLLHLLGYNDKTSADKDRMTAQEDYYLNQLNALIISD